MNDQYSISLDYELILNLAKTRKWESFKIENGRLIFVGLCEQEIEPVWLEGDLELLNESNSFIGAFDRECMIIRIHCENDFTYSSNIIKGRKRNVSNVKEIKNLIDTLVFKARSVGHEVVEIEVAHTHLTRQFASVNRGGEVVKISTQPLSDADIATHKQLKQFISTPITFKAITKDQICYKISA